jgi:hypothetical protein
MSTLLPKKLASAVWKSLHLVHYSAHSAQVHLVKRPVLRVSVSPRSIEKSILDISLSITIILAP